MSNSYKLKFTQIASDDLEHIFMYISSSLSAMQAANKLMDKIQDSVMRLKEFPYSCSFVAEEMLKNKGYRKLIVDNYVAFYLVDEEEKQVVIMRIMYGVQQYEKLL